MGRYQDNFCFSSGNHNDFTITRFYSVFINFRIKLPYLIDVFFRMTKIYTDIFSALFFCRKILHWDWLNLNFFLITIKTSYMQKLWLSVQRWRFWFASTRNSFKTKSVEIKNIHFNGLFDLFLRQNLWVIFKKQHNVILIDKKAFEKSRIGI